MSEKQVKSRAQRFAVIIIATLINEGGQNIPIRVRNFSETGLGVSADQPLSIGEKVRIDLRGLRLAGQVVRRTGSVFGIRVDSQIKVDEITRRPASKTIFVVSDIHKIENRAYRPGLKRPKSAK